MRARPILLLTLLLAAVPATAQIYGHQDESLSQREIDTLRDTAYDPPLRVLAFLKFLDVRAGKIQELSAKPRHSGRELDLHDLYSQFADIVDELNDNLDEYGPQHRDLRKALPKLQNAIPGWQSILRSVEPDERYDVARKLAMASVNDVAASVDKLLPEQIAYFKEHPEEAKAQAARSKHETFDTETHPPPK